VPDSKSLWSVSNSSTTLDENNEIILEWSNNSGQTFQTFISVDKDYLFNVKQVVKNNSSEEIIINNNSKVIRKKAPQLSGMFILHEGPIGVLQEELELIDYDDLKEDKDVLNYESDNGWIGITDKYWLAALIPDQNIPFKSIYAYDDNLGYVAYFRSLDSYSVKPNTKIEIDSKVFAGAKEADLLDLYQEKYNIYNFDLAIDWGWFYFIT
jgi:YidC/Oxa1 family membrane protein insertase